MHPKLLTMAQVATILSVSLPRAYELARSGLMPSVRIGRQVRVDEDRLLQWIKDGGSALPETRRRA